MNKYNPVRGSAIDRRITSGMRRGKRISKPHNSELRKMVKRETNRAIRRQRSQHPLYSAGYWA